MRQEDHLKEELSAIQEELFEIRHDFHRHPELSGREERTARRIRDELEKAGLSWRAVGGTGTLAELQGRLPGPTVLLRADIDALPIRETGRFPFPSENDGVMHACGHDIHMTALLGAVKVLAKRKDDLYGSIRFVFQQAEEVDHGSAHFLREGVADGALRIYGFHVCPDTPFGTAILTDGTDAASCDRMTIRVRGKGAHIAKPHLGRNAALAAADIALHLSQLPSRHDPMENVLIGIGRIDAGHTWNVIPDCAEIEGTIRTLSMSARARLLDEVKDTIQKTAALHGVIAEMELELQTPCLVNDTQACETMYGAALQVFGDRSKIIRKPVPFGFAGDDFAAYTEKIPGCFIHVGTAVAGEADTSVPLHSDNYYIHDEVIPIGSEILIRCALAHLAESKRS